MDLKLYLVITGMLALIFFCAAMFFRNEARRRGAQPLSKAHKDYMWALTILALIIGFLIGLLIRLL